MRNREFWERFVCHRCGRCCSELGLPYDPFALKDIANFLNISLDELVEKYYGTSSDDKKHLILQDEKRKPCPFLSKDEDRAICNIYPVRPRGCRAFPFDTDFGRNGVDCPGAKDVSENGVRLDFLCDQMESAVTLGRKEKWGKVRFRLYVAPEIESDPEVSPRIKPPQRA